METASLKDVMNKTFLDTNLFLVRNDVMKE